MGRPNKHSEALKQKVLDLLAKGYTVRQIEIETGVSKSAVGRYKQEMERAA